MQHFVEQGALEGPWKGGGSSAEGSVPMSLHAAVVVRHCGAQLPASLYPAAWCVGGLGLTQFRERMQLCRFGTAGTSRGLPLHLEEIHPCLQEVVAGRGSVSPSRGAAGGGQQPAQHQGWHRGDGPPSEAHLREYVGVR